MQYQAKMQYDEKAIRQLAIVQYDTFCLLQIMIAVAAAFIMLMAGVFAGLSLLPSMILIFGSCWTLWSIRLPGEISGDKLIKGYGKAYPCVAFEFADDAMHVSVKEKEEKIGYGRIFRIIEDKENYYIFLSKVTGYVLGKKQLGSKEMLSAFSRFMEAKTGLSIQTHHPLYRVNLLDLITRIKNGKKARYAGGTG